MTPALRSLVADAEAAGFTVTTDDNAIILKRGRGVHDHSLPARGAAVMLTETGAFSYAYRIDIEPSLAITIRTIGDVRAAIGI